MESDGECGWPRVHSRGGVSRRVSIATLGLCVGVLSAACIASACGSTQGTLSPGPSALTVTTRASGEGSAATAIDVASPTTVATDAPSTTSTAGPLEPETSIAQVFAQIAEVMALAPTYEMTELPSGITIAATWWPVLFMAAPTDYEGPVVSNPRIGGEGPGGHEVQLVLAMGGGWLVILENFRGDLGDVSGRPVGQVGGRDATLYELNGGVLVQWSDQGAWYGVFGRGLATTEIVRIALSMTRVARGH
jgi:hypothetical protein